MVADSWTEAGMGVASPDLAALAAWMDGQGLGGGPIHAAQRIPGGSTYLLLRFERGDRGYVLRLPPPRKRATCGPGMRREARVLAALADGEVPHPRLIAACPEGDVLGAPFYLMEPIEGANLARGLPSRYRTNLDWQRRLGLSVVDAVAALGRLDIDASGLRDLGRTQDWPRVQVHRWRTRWSGYRAVANYPGAAAEDGVDAADVADWLDRHRPARCRLGLVHGDLHLGNVLVGHEAPEVAALVDWELAALGDPLLDLGHLVAVWPGRPAAAWLAAEIPGLPGPQEVIERYAQRTGRDLADLDWFRVLACFRLAVILEGARARMLAGLADPPFGHLLADLVRALFVQAREIAN